MASSDSVFSIRSARFLADEHVRKQILRRIEKRRRVWPVFVFAAAFGIVSAILAKPHDLRPSYQTQHATSNR